jgi:polyisoprenoid-binding protein YceI
MSAPTGLEPLFAEGRWRVDRANSVVGLRVRHLLVRTVVGCFRDFDGVVATGATPSIVGTIRAASLETDCRERDERLRSPGFFDVEKYPELTFASRHVGFGAGGTMLLAGELTIKGCTRPIELVGVFRGVDAKPGGRERIAFDLCGRLRRTDYGLTWSWLAEPRGILVDDVVELALGIAAVREVGLELAA